jgi:multicomponent Na+:H+ antiporter subunit D
VLFLVPALSLTGIPPLSGFFAKLALLQAGLAAGQYAIAAVALAVSLLTLFSMFKIWNEAFWKPRPIERPTEAASGEPPPSYRPASMAMLVVPCVVLAAITVSIGAAAEPVFVLSLDVAEQLLGRDEYVRAVLGAGDAATEADRP